MSARIRVLGRGVLNWRPDERISDRYGYVHLAVSPMCSPMDLGGDHAPLDFGELLGARVVLKALILLTRRSPHIGDIAHGIYPTTPEQGDVIELGRGILFTQMTAFGAEVGIKPVPYHSTWWLDPRALYRVHNQTVQLFVEELDAPG